MRGFDVSSTYSSNEFVPKLLNSQAFSLFVQENGPPYRYLHKFDEVSTFCLIVKFLINNCCI